MFRTAVLASLLPAVLGAVSVAAGQSLDPTVSVSLSKTRGVDRGDRLRTYVRAEADGYVVVLHAEPDGRLRMLFPIDPRDDHFVRGGREYEIRGRGDRHAFTVYETAGTGFVYAAFSRDPFQFGEFVLGDHWDYTLPEWYVGTDAEAELTSLVQRMTGFGRFDYDVVRYDVGVDVAYLGHADYRLSLYEPYYRGHDWHGHSAFSISFGFGRLYSPWHYHYRPFRWAYYYDPFYWDPWYYDPYYYDPYYYYPGFYNRPVYWGHPRTVYVRAPRSRSFGERRYVFKSNSDRFGLQPDVIQPRRRTYVSNVSTSASRRVVTAPRAAPSNPPSISGRRAPAPRSSAPAAGAAPTDRRTAPAVTTPTDRRAAPTRRGLTERTVPDEPTVAQPRGTQGIRRLTPGSEREPEDARPAVTPPGDASGRRTVLRPRSETTRPAAQPSRESATSNRVRRVAPTRRSPAPAARPAPRPAPRPAARPPSRSRPAPAPSAGPSSGSRRAAPSPSSSRSGSSRSTPSRSTSRRRN